MQSYSFNELKQNQQFTEGDSAGFLRSRYRTEIQKNQTVGYCHSCVISKLKSNEKVSSCKSADQQHNSSSIQH